MPTTSSTAHQVADLLRQAVEDAPKLQAEIDEFVVDMIAEGAIPTVTRVGQDDSWSIRDQRTGTIIHRNDTGGEDDLLEFWAEHGHAFAEVPTRANVDDDWNTEPPFLSDLDEDAWRSLRDWAITQPTAAANILSVLGG